MPSPATKGTQQATPGKVLPQGHEAFDVFVALLIVLRRGEFLLA
jgi:hypothetical protein